MSNSLNRRNWIKSSAMMAGGLAFLPGVANKLMAAPTHNLLHGSVEVPFLSEAEVAASNPPELKARLNANENPFGPSPAAKKALEDAVNDSFRYPFGSLQQLSAKIAEHEGVSPQNILLSSGSSPLLLAA